LLDDGMMPPIRGRMGDLRCVAICNTSRKRRATFLGAQCNHHDKICLAQQCWQMSIQHLATIHTIKMTWVIALYHQQNQGNPNNNQGNKIVEVLADLAIL
jgi:hypothetical protein